MDFSASQKGLPEQLILAGIDELGTHGVHDFSLRRVAGICGVSCAAPYKHFKDKQSLISAIIAYIDKLWRDRHKSIRAAKDLPLGRQLVDICMEYIRFLSENSNFIPIVMLKQYELNSENSALRGQLTKETYALVDRYCKAVNMPLQTRKRKTFITRCLVYGAVLMFDNGQLAYDEENLDMVRSSIDDAIHFPKA